MTRKAVSSIPRRGLIFVACVLGVALAVVAWIRLRPTDGIQEKRTQASEGVLPKAALSEVYESLTKEERHAVDLSKIQTVRDLYTVGYASAKHPRLCEDHLDAILEMIKASPNVFPVQKSDQTISHPDHAMFGLSILVRAWTRGAKIDRAGAIMQAEAVRVSACDDEVIRSQCAAVLSEMRDKKLGGGLSPAASKHLDTLMANEVVAMFAHKALDAWHDEDSK